MDDAADLQTQSVSVSVNPVHKRKHVVASDNNGQPGTSGNAVTEETTRSLTLSELRDIHEDYSHQEGEQVVTWLLRCRDTGADSLDLDGRESKQLAPLARESDIDRALGRPPQSLTLWRRLLLSVRSRYPYRDDIMYQPPKWTTIERGVKNLREIAVREMIFSNLDDLQTSLDPDAVQITGPIWRKWVLSAPAAYANVLALFCWRDNEALTVGDMDAQMQHYANKLLSAPQELNADKIIWQGQCLSCGKTLPY
ncbi:ubiquitin carboxyl-terminal hydrolase 4 [Limosa lapponica baueri]|uniref:Ubiquitin carboxyl-terminal hydrolase 4 n=1 Tax=Limosa lapponica baueri TaxID=1758121 RepID=A0A2I0T5R3_LIMLA|nr:ubiquitin carboxyl-terminal hydrolase 4 [Limosa lapponica baueri]